MKKPYALPVFITVSFIFGVLLGFCWKPELQLLYLIFGVSFFVFLVTFFRAKRLVFQDIFFGAATFLLLCVVGMINTQWHQPENNSNHYIHENYWEPALMKLKVLEVLKSSTYQHNYVAELESLNGRRVEGKILLTIQRDSTFAGLAVDENLFLKTDLSDIFSPLNLYQFDYAKHMASKNILKQARVHPDEIYISSNQTLSFQGRASRLRSKIKQNLKRSNFSAEQISLIEALLLGQKRELSKDTYSKFADAGVVHVLAVSGLHVGVLLYFLMFLLRPLLYLPKGKIIRSCLLIILLWVYAYIVGLSPSILRAVTMFSFLSLGMFFQRKVFSINMLCLSALVLVIVNPNNILAVGFQLSYAAVLSILLFYKKFMLLFPERNSVFKRIGSLISVTFSAQLGVLPLSLYYFHQFPGLFFISNLLILPFLGIILGAGVFVILLSSFTKLPLILVEIYGGILDLLQMTVNWVAEKDSFLFKHIYFSPSMLILSVILIGLLAATLHLKSKLYRWLLGIMIIILQLVYVYEYNQRAEMKRFYIFHQNRASVLGFHHGKDIEIVSNTTKNQTWYFEKGIKDALGIKELQYSTGIKNYYKIDDFELLIIDSVGVWQLPPKTYPTDILLSHSPKIILVRVWDSLKPQRVIADGSNYKNMVRRWKQTCADKKIPFHYTGEKGMVSIEF